MYQGGVVEGDHVADGAVDNALGFNGGYLSIANDSVFNSTESSVTMSAWVRLHGLQSGERAIVRKENQWAMDIYPADGETRWLVNTTGGTEGWTDSNDLLYTFSINKWNHFAFVYNGSTLETYVDGVLIGSAVVSGTIEIQSDPIGIAARGTGGLELDADIDEVRIYSRAFTSAEIQKHYVEGLKDHQVLASK